MAKRIRRGMVVSRVRGKMSGLERIWGNTTINSDFGWVYDFENLCSVYCDNFLIVIMITMPYTEYSRKVVALMLQKKVSSC